MDNNYFVLQTTYSKDNFGSILQCYATQYFFNEYNINCILVKQKEKGVLRYFFAFKRRIDSIVIRLLYKSARIEYKKQNISSLGMMKALDPETRIKIDAFFEHYIQSNEFQWLTLKRISRSEKCIFCIAGSDQIWNSNRVVLDDLYFLTFSPKSKRIAWMPSFGTETVAPYNINRYSKRIKGFRLLSAREASGAHIIKNLSNRNAQLFLDPVFLMDTNEWMQISKESTISLNKNYALAFFLNDPNSIALAEIDELLSRGKTIVCIGYPYDSIISKKGINFISTSPIDFLWFVSNADIVLTDSFHAVSFSIIFHKQFLVYDRNYINDNQSTRIKNLLDIFNLNKHFVGKMEDNNIKNAEYVDTDFIDSIIIKNKNKVIDYCQLHRV